MSFSGLFQSSIWLKVLWPVLWEFTNINKRHGNSRFCQMLVRDNNLQKTIYISPVESRGSPQLRKILHNFDFYSIIVDSLKIFICLFSLISSIFDVFVLRNWIFGYRSLLKLRRRSGLALPSYFVTKNVLKSNYSHVHNLWKSISWGNILS